MVKKKIIISSALGTVGGNETHILSLSKLLAQEHYEVSIMNRASEFKEKYFSTLNKRKIEIHSIPFKGSVSPLIRNMYAFMAWQKVFKSQCNNIFLCLGPGGFHRVIKNQFTNKPISVYWEAGDAINCTNYTQLKMLKDMDYLAATSTPVATKLNNYTNKKVYVLRPLTLIPDISIKPFTKNIANQIQVGFIGRITKEKGVDLLINAWAYLKPHNCKLKLYGTSNEIDELKKLVNEKCENGSVEFMGEFVREKDLHLIMNKIDLLVLPSLSEGLPHVLIEAMAYGVPFLSTDVGGITDFKAGNPDVCIVPPNLNSIIQGLRLMIRKYMNGQLNRERLYKYYINNYSVDIISKEWMNFMDNISKH